jgi:hypothetical protein
VFQYLPQAQALVLIPGYLALFAQAEQEEKAQALALEVRQARKKSVLPQALKARLY